MPLRSAAPSCTRRVVDVKMMVSAALQNNRAGPQIQLFVAARRARACVCAESPQRHGVKLKKLNRPADQRKAMLRALTTELIRHGRIQSTLVRCKEVRRTADRMVTLAKDGSLHEAAGGGGVGEGEGKGEGGADRCELALCRRGEEARPGGERRRRCCRWRRAISSMRRVPAPSLRHRRVMT